MPHTRAARLRALKEASQYRDMLQSQDASASTGWNEYLNWDYPYQQDSTYASAPEVTWYPSDAATTDQLPLYDDACLSEVDGVNDRPGTNGGQSLSADFNGLQPWYSTATQESLSANSAATTLPQLANSMYAPYGSTSALDESLSHIYDPQQRPSDLSRRLSAASDDMHPQKHSDTQTIDHTDELAEIPSPSSEEENERICAAKVNANKKRKIAHSVIEKNYRTRINVGMAELRHCVPSTRKGRSSTDSDLTEGQRLTGYEPLNHSSGKVATISDAVQYVKTLELRNEALHGRLDVMQRRNVTLQKIALSKADTNTPASEAAGEEPSHRVQNSTEGRTPTSNGGRRTRASPADGACSSSDRKSAQNEFRHISTVARAVQGPSPILRVF